MFHRIPGRMPPSSPLPAYAILLPPAITIGRLYCSGAISMKTRRCGGAGPDNKRVLLWYSRHYMQMHMLFGMPPLISAGRDTLPLFLQMYNRPNYHGNSTILYGTQVENSDLFPRQADLAQRWNSIYVFPHLQYAGFHEALQAMEKQSGDSIPTIHGDGGPYWEDGAAADALYLSMERRNEARAQTAEKLATLGQFVNPILKINTAELSQMWTDMVLMDEHTADSYNSVSDPASSEAVDQLALKDHLAVDAKAQVDFITKRSMANLADVIPADSGSVIVFNSLNWKRSGTVSLDLDKGVELVDAVSNRPVPFEVLDSGNGFNRVRFPGPGCSRDGLQGVWNAAGRERHRGSKVRPGQNAGKPVLHGAT